MNIYSKTDRGRVRRDNQDYCLSGKIAEGSLWAVVCDGMGGANGGHTASTTASEYIAREIKNLYTSDFTKEELITLLTNVVVGANLEVYNIARKNIELTGMGTTCELVFIRNNIIHIVHVGDSRTYIIRDNKAIQLTEDHSLVQEMVNRGEITKLTQKMSEKGYSCVPTKMYFENGLVKVEIALAKGKKLYDKRETLKDKSIKKDIEIAARNFDKNKI